MEVGLPLDASNASAGEKSIRHGHPSTLHLWWPRQPLAVAPAVIFSRLAHDPEILWRCQNPGVERNQQHKAPWAKARARLFAIIEDLMKWENTTNETVLKKAREEIRKAWQETCELNRGYASARARWSMEFGLPNHDVLWVLDEVQLMDIGLATSTQLQVSQAEDHGKRL